MSEKKLKQVLNFDEADLGANRLGQLTQRQKDLLGEKFKSNRMLYTIIGALIVLSVCGGLFRVILNPILSAVGSGLVESGTVEPSSFMPALPFILIGGVFALFFGFIIFLILRVVFGKANRQADMAVRSAQGKVNFVWVESRERNLSKAGPMYKTIRSLEMRVGEDTNFKGVNSDLPNLINQGEEWIVYYVNHPFKILSVEQAK